MSKPDKNQDAPATQADAFEMIELACDDLDALARAFNLIDEVCQEHSDSSGAQLSSEENTTKIVWN